MRGNQATLMRALYEAGAVQRWHTLPHHGEQIVAAHSWGVAAFILTFHDGNPSANTEFRNDAGQTVILPGPSPRLVRAAILHDSHERWSGDNPSPARRAMPSLQQGEDEAQERFWLWSQEDHPEAVLTPEELVWLRLGDMVDAWWWCLQQLRMGNQHAWNACGSIKDAIDAMIRENEGQFVDADGLLVAIGELDEARLPESLKNLEERF